MDPQTTGAPARSVRRRLLLLSPFAPRLDASMGGPRVIAQLVMALSLRERLALVYLRSPEEPPLDERVRAACEVAVEVLRTEGSPGALLDNRRKWSAASLVRGIPPWVAEWHEPGVAPVLRSLAAAWQPDIVQVEFHLMGQYLPALGRSRPPTVLNQHDPGAAAALDRRRLGLMPGRFLPWWELRAWGHYERWLAREVDAIVTFTERDRHAMQAAGATSPIYVIPPGAVVPETRSDPRGMEPPALLFFGNYLHSPNVDAAMRLARTIFPRLRQHIPNLRLWLPGDHAPAALSQLAGEQVVVPGRVPCLAPYLDRAAVVVVPIRGGGGMRVKVLEALAAGKAVVASPRALEGLEVADGEQVLYAESDEDFVRRVLWLLRQPEERAAIATRARAWATANLSWDRVAEQYSALYDELLRSSRRHDR